MAGDDKTIFNPGVSNIQADPNATILIPNPGRRLRPETDAPPPGEQPPQLAPHRPPPSSLKGALKGQPNSILSASNTLITVLSALSNSMSHPNIAQLQQELATEMGNLDARLNQAGVRSEEALSARYVLCAAIDEAAMNTPWGVDSGWGQRSLLRVYHNETSGGERFFTLLDQLTARPQEYRDLLELFYVLLCMGFKGKYQLDPTGGSRIETLRERLHQDLYGGRSYERSLSESARVTDIARPRLRNQIPLWVVLSLSLALTLVIYTGLRTWMYSGTVDIVDRFDDLYTVERSN